MDDRFMEIEPPRADLGQLQLTNKHEMVPVENDVLGVVQRLKRIDPALHMLYDMGQEIFVLYHRGFNEQGHVTESLVGAYKELDQRIVKLIERIDVQGRGHQDLAKELERLDRENDRENAHRRMEKVGPIGEELRFALRRELGFAGDQAHMSGSREKFRRRKR